MSNYEDLTENQLRSWSRIHRMATEAVTLEKQLEFKNYMIYLSNYFPCGSCIPHIREYLYANPIKSGFGEKGFSKWSWRFHNSVNKKSKKKYFFLEKI